MLLLSIALMLYGCGKKSDSTQDSDTRNLDNYRKPESSKPIISIADLMIDKVLKDPIANIEKLRTLREDDKKFYKALLKDGSSLSRKYFYARRGSCCPCTADGMNCCKCSSGSAFGIPVSELVTAKVFESQKSVFMLTQMGANPKDEPKLLKLHPEEQEGMKIFTLPKDAIPKGNSENFKVSFKSPNGNIDLTFIIEVDSKGEFEIYDIP